MRTVKAPPGAIAVGVVHSSRRGAGYDKLAVRYEASLYIAIINDWLLTSLWDNP